jgi:phosphoglycolate phosphatase-like HAD superfamily hydrolase
LSTSPNEPYRILNPLVIARLGAVRHVLFDFDGTLSVLRQGWEPVMEAVMLEAICPEGAPSTELTEEVRAYIDASTGRLTIQQMQWLRERVRSFGAQPRPLSAPEYKKIYLKALMVSVAARLADLESGRASPQAYLLQGALDFVRGLAQKGLRLYIASGSDHPDVVHEASALGLSAYFQDGMYGALDSSEANGKERVIQRILDEHRLAGPELLVVGDGPVEILEGRQHGAITLGVASDEVKHHGWNQHKIARLARAGADLLAPDFSDTAGLLRLLFP